MVCIPGKGKMAGKAAGAACQCSMKDKTDAKGHGEGCPCCAKDKADEKKADKPADDAVKLDLPPTPTPATPPADAAERTSTPTATTGRSPKSSHHPSAAPTMPGS